MRRLTALLVAALALPTLSVIAAAPAAAHAVLVASDPTDGARLSVAPARVTLTFDEPIRLVTNGVRVISDTGVRVDTGPTLAANGTTIVLPLEANLPEGSYTATWDVISADTHEVAGSVSFGVGRDARAGPAGLDRANHKAGEIAAALARGGQFVGLVLGLGIVLVCAALWPWTLRVQATRTLCAVGLALLLGASLAELVIVAGHDTTIAGRQEFVVLARTLIAGLLVAIVPRSIREPRRAGFTAIGVLGAAVSATIAVDGHAGAGTDALLATLATTAHVCAMTVWLGGLVALCLVVLPSQHTDNLRRWSSTAFICVGVLVATGFYQGWRQVAPVEALWSTTYGLTLCLKVCIVCVMVVIAYLARRRLTPTRLRRMVPLEAAVGVIVLVVTMVLVASPPARTSFGPPITLDAPLDNERHVHVAISSTRRGPTTIRATVLDSSGRPAPALSLAGTLSSREAQIPSLPVDFTLETNDWVSTYASAPRPGLWTLRLTVRLGPTDAIVTSAGFQVW
ncbi:copper resistance CopC/CopD family protein [Mycolicibacterium helvum]|uniref:Transport integral membrane protein n=1 Tax=Mycolicibacterium helvum TaxID=1534349 RepID=A0A7I7TB57_9MYCO|nr:copper resistance protein CopC [Mycolicibacterium helvum]BBY65575.1 hypothetical protein MHEL_38180 [Mycolicibacterium helvum]